MKIIEALKLVKDLQRKAEDLQGKVQRHSAHLSYETPTYPDQKSQVAAWVQSHTDIVREIARLRCCIQRTNVTTPVTIELDGNHVTKPIAEWIHRRRDLAKLEAQMYRQLTDRGLKEGSAKNTMGETVDVKIVRCYDPAARDHRLAALDSEPSIIDGRLEIVNATTDLVE